MKHINWGTFFVFGLFFFCSFGYALAPFWLIFGFVIVYLCSQDEGKREKKPSKKELREYKIQIENENLNQRESLIEETRKSEWESKRRDSNTDISWLGEENDLVKCWYKWNPEFYLDLVHASQDELLLAGIDDEFVNEVHKLYEQKIENLKSKESSYKLINGNFKPEYEFFRCFGKLMTEEQILKSINDRDTEFMAAKGVE